MAEIDFECNALDDVTLYNNLDSSNNTFSLLNLNVQSIRNKFPDFECFLSTFSSPFDVICITETWLHNDEIQFFKLPGYTFVGSQRVSRGGGVGAYVRGGLVAGSAEEVTVCMSGADAVSFVLGGRALEDSRIQITVVYRQPSTALGPFLCDLEGFISTQSPRHILVGDLNIDALDPHFSDEYSSIISNYAFVNTINVPTRYSTAKASCLDHILINFFCKNVKSGTIQADISDHLPTYLKFEIILPNSISNTSSSKSVRTTTDYTKLH